VREAPQPARRRTPRRRVHCRTRPQTMDETTAFVREHELVSLVDDPCVIQEMPEFRAGRAVAYWTRPGRWRRPRCPRSTASRRPVRWTRERVESFYRESTTTWFATSPCTRRCPATSCRSPTLAGTPGPPGSGRCAVRAFIEGWAVLRRAGDGRSRRSVALRSGCSSSRCSCA
jgi:hypothetical protein